SPPWRRTSQPAESSAGCGPESAGSAPDSHSMPTIDSDIFASVPTAIAIAHDPLATSITVNRHFATLLGLDGEAPAAWAGPPGNGADWAIYRAGRRVTPDELPLQVAARTQAAVSGWEAEIERRDGTRVAIAGDAVPLYHEDGTVRGSVVVFRDISSRTAAGVVEVECGHAATLAEEQAARREAEAAMQHLHQANRLK